METVIKNGKIQIDENIFVESIYIKENKVFKVGSNEEVSKYITDSTKVIDAGNKLVIPGLNDSHMHLLGVGKFLSNVNCYGATTIEEIVQRGKDFILEKNLAKEEVLHGRGWNQDYFTDDKRLLTRHDLDKISKNHPVVLRRACGHLATCNTKALEMLNIDKKTMQIEGGVFEVEEDGYPSGIFNENALKLLEPLMPASNVKKIKSELKLAIEHAISHGLTSIQTNDLIEGENDFEYVIQAFEELRDNKELKVRVCLQCCFDTVEGFQLFIDNGFTNNYGDEKFKVGPLKLFIDGSLGARTALLRNTYNDDDTTTGVAWMSESKLGEMVRIANSNNVQVVVHAIGDSGIDQVLTAYENVIDKYDNKLRHGVIHCQITDNKLLQRFKNKDILAMVQPIFLHYDLHIVEDRVGKDLASTSYAFGTLEELGVNTSYGTDAPIEDLNPFHSMHCAINRQDLNLYPKEGFYNEQCVSVETAVRNYTKAGAHASFEEGIKGTLNEGMLADLVILDTDIYTVDKSKIKDTQVILTMIDGEIVFQR